MRVICSRVLDAGGCPPVDLRRQSKLPKASRQILEAVPLPQPAKPSLGPRALRSLCWSSLQQLPLPRCPRHVTALGCPLALALRSSLETCWDYKNDISSGALSRGW